MKIYFAGSIRGGREDADLYLKTIEFLKGFGEVLTEHVGDKTLSIIGEDGPDDRYIHDRDLNWLQSCDMVIAEVTKVSLGVGYEIGRAVENNKPVLCLYRPDKLKKLSAMISGSPEVMVKNYRNLEEAKRIISEFLEQRKGSF